MAGNSKMRFLVTAEGWTAGKWRNAGDVVELTKAEAKYETAIEPESASPKGGKRKAGGDAAG